MIKCICLYMCVVASFRVVYDISIHGVFWRHMSVGGFMGRVPLLFRPAPGNKQKAGLQLIFMEVYVIERVCLMYSTNFVSFRVGSSSLEWPRPGRDQRVK